MEIKSRALNGPFFIVLYVILVCFLDRSFDPVRSTTASSPLNILCLEINVSFRRKISSLLIANLLSSVRYGDHSGFFFGVV